MDNLQIMIVTEKKQKEKKKTAKFKYIKLHIGFDAGARQKHLLKYLFILLFGGDCVYMYFLFELSTL